MKTHYCVLQYLPNPVAGERVNFGIIAYDGERVRARFLERWERVSRFSGRDIGFLRRFADGFQTSLEKDESPSHGQINEKTLMRMAERWTHSIQLTAPRPSTQPLDELLNEMSELFLIESKRRAPRYRGRDVAARIAADRVRAAVEEQIPDLASEYFHRRSELKGDLEEHQLDAVVANGRAILGAQGLSFENPDGKAVARDVSAVAFAMRDIRDNHEKLPLGVVTLVKQGANPTPELRRAKHIFKELRVEVLRPEETKDWAQGIVRRAVPRQGVRR